LQSAPDLWSVAEVAGLPDGGVPERSRLSGEAKDLALIGGAVEPPHHSSPGGKTASFGMTSWTR